MSNTDQLAPDTKPASPLPGCEEKRAREVHPIEGPCPLCGEIQEYFSDELAKETMRCYDCKKSFNTSLFKETTGS